MCHSLLPLLDELYELIERPFSTMHDHGIVVGEVYERRVPTYAEPLLQCRVLGAIYGCDAHSILEVVGEILPYAYQSLAMGTPGSVEHYHICSR